MRRIKTETPRAGAAAGLLLLPLAGACSPPPAEAPETTGVTVFEGARLIVGDGSDPLENAAFVVDEDRFAAVGAAGEVEAPASAARVDLTGRRRASASRRATWRGSTRRASASPSAPTATRAGVRTWRWPTWWPPA